MAFQFVRRAAMAFAAVASLTSFGDVFDDALIWWRGAYDENGDGSFSASQFYNHRYAKTDEAHQKNLATLTGDSTISIVNDDVVSVWSGKTNNFPVLRFNQDAVDSPSVLSLVPRNVGLAEPVTELTIHLRFKWDGDFGAQTKATSAVLFSTVNHWNCRGFEFHVANGKAIIKTGRKNYDCTHVGIEAGTWYDLFLYTADSAYKDPAQKDHNCSLWIGLVKATGSQTTLWPGLNHSGSTWLEPKKVNTNWACTSTAFDPADTIAIGNNFKGKIAQFGFWPRQLSGSDMAEISCSPGMGQTLLSVGRADGTNNEFAKSLETAQSSVSLPGTWDGIPPVLSKAFPSVSFTFKEKSTPVYDTKSGIGTGKPSYSTTFDHVLVIKAAADCGSCALDVRLDKGTAKEVKLGKRSFTAGSAEYFWLPAHSSGTHTIDLTCVNGTFTPDYAKLYGSWCLGARVYAYTSDNKNQYNGSTAPYPIEWDIPEMKMSGGLSADAAEYVDSGTSTISMDLDEEFTQIGYKYYVATGQSKDQKKTTGIVYVNGVKYGSYTNPWQYGDIGPIEFPAGTFKAGRNTIAVRYDPEATPSHWVTVRGHYLAPIQTSLPEPTKYNAGMILKLK